MDSLPSSVLCCPSHQQLQPGRAEEFALKDRDEEGREVSGLLHFTQTILRHVPHHSSRAPDRSDTHLAGRTNSTLYGIFLLLCLTLKAASLLHHFPNNLPAPHSRSCLRLFFRRSQTGLRSNFTDVDITNFLEVSQPKVAEPGHLHQFV
jgi:hypothetical protein